MKLFKKSSRVDPAQIDAQADAATERLSAQQPRVNTITAWLEERKNQNGFGRDFEYSLIPKESK